MHHQMNHKTQFYHSWKCTANYIIPTQLQWQYLSTESRVLTQICLTFLYGIGHFLHSILNFLKFVLNLTRCTIARAGYLVFRLLLLWDRQYYLIWQTCSRSSQCYIVNKEACSLWPDCLFLSHPYTGTQKKKEKNCKLQFQMRLVKCIIYVHYEDVMCLIFCLGMRCTHPLTPLSCTQMSGSVHACVWRAGLWRES